MNKIRQIYFNYFLLVVFLPLSLFCFGQDKSPTFPGGDQALECFIYNNIDSVKISKIDSSGLVIATFIVDTTGELKYAKIIRSLNPIADKELLRLIAIMPSWIPGKKSGKYIPLTVELPLTIPFPEGYCRKKIFLISN
ncbi:MAG: hypothetical protein HXX16_20105 [Bacteroidales bacterium]|nr:hypothetical protein [Bacteroidales bacterium]